jgi:hypothetical protein
VEAEEKVGVVAAEDVVMDEARGVRVAVKDEERVELAVEVEAEDADLASILWMSRLSRPCKQGNRVNVAWNSLVWRARWWDIEVLLKLRSLLALL